MSFTGFAVVMAGPSLVVVALEYLAFRLWFRADLPVASDGAPAPAGTAAPPRFALAVLALTLLGFGVSSLVGLEPVWVAAVGALFLAARSFAAGRIRPGALIRAADLPFCLFVLALGVVVQGVAAHGLGTGLAAVLPTAPTLGGMLRTATSAALLANLLNNLPATLLLIAVLGNTPEPGIVLAVLIGVNIGPNLTYLGSLATLLWRRVLDGTGAAPDLREFSWLGLLTVPPCLVGAVLAMWAALPLVR